MIFPELFVTVCSVYVTCIPEELRMRKCVALILSLMILLGVWPAGALTDEKVYSIEAAEEYRDAWNAYFSEKGMDLEIGYFLTDDQTQIDSFDVLYYGPFSESDSLLEAIPATASLFFIYDVRERTFGFCVIDNNLKSDLEKIVIYTDDRVFSDLDVICSHEDYDMWSVTIDEDTIRAMRQNNQVTVRLTVGGKSEVFDISPEDNKLLIDLYVYLLQMRQYTDPGDTKYLSQNCLPENKPIATPEQTDKPAGLENAAVTAYSFREDLEALDKAAKSVFYVEIYDGMFNCLGNASGFVAFDEHLLVTNQHVIDGAAFIKIWDEDNKMYILQDVVMSDKLHDIAILAFDAGKKYDALEYDLDTELMRGQPVVTIGSPNGFQGTVAFGNISAFPVIPQYGNEKAIQYTAPVSHGSSGGALFDDRGKVIGITSAINEAGQNINFAIPIRLVKDLYDQWDKSSYESLGSERSWDMVGVTPTPEPTPTPTPSPAPTPVPAGFVLEGTAETLPTGEEVNVYGEITDLTYFRAGPSSYSALKKGALKAGQVVLIVTNETNERNEIWSKVIVDETEGYVRSKDIRPLSDEETAPPVPDVTAIPTPEPTPEPTAEPTKAPAGNGPVVHVDLTEDNFLEYFDVSTDEELDDKNVTFKYTVSPKETAGEITEDSSFTIFVTMRFCVYSDQNDESEIGRTETTVMLKRDEGYRYKGEAKLKLDEYMESVYWDGEVTYVYGHLN